MTAALLKTLKPVENVNSKPDKILKPLDKPSNLKPATVDKSDKLKLEVEKALQKAVVNPGFEPLKTIPPYEMSKKALQRERKKEREKTKKNWYGLPATEVTEELKQDLEVLQMRSVLDPKHFYKKNDLKVLPKYFRVIGFNLIKTHYTFYNIVF